MEILYKLFNILAFVLTVYGVASFGATAIIWAIYHSRLTKWKKFDEERHITRYFFFKYHIYSITFGVTIYVINQHFFKV